MTWGVDGVTVAYGEVAALREVTVNLAPGEIGVVVGGDGAGKTTLCRTLVGLEEAVSGGVTRPGRTAYQPATSGVWADLTVMENLAFVAGGYGLDTDRAKRRIDELLEATDLTEATERLGRELSGGMRQKLGVAMAVISEPELLVLDEPTTGLDPISRLELWSFIVRSAREGRAVLMTTTYVDEAERGDTVLGLDEGSVLASGSVDDVISAMPGKVFDVPDWRGSLSWHRGESWRVWSPEGNHVDGGTQIQPDLSDVVTVAALARSVR